MKIIAIGDIHGRDVWKKIVNTETFDKVVFIGDYFDSFDISGCKQIENFKDIIAYKKANMDKVVLLFGNHDYHYTSNAEEIYSGFQPVYSFDVSELIHQALDEDLLQMCYKYNQLLFTHAGVTKVWFNNHIGISYSNIENKINDLFRYKPNSFRFDGYDPSGNDVTQSPIWVRPESLIIDPIKGFVQVVGHTSKRQITNIDDQIILIDVLGTQIEYLIYENNNISTKILKQ